MRCQSPQGCSQPNQGCCEDGSKLLLCPGLWDRPCCPCLQLPAQQVKSLGVNKAQGQQMTHCQHRRSFSQGWALPAGLLQGIKHSLEAAFGQGQTPWILTKLLLQNVQQRQHRRKNPSFLLLIKLLKKGIASGGVCKEELSQCQRSNQPALASVL